MCVCHSLTSSLSDLNEEAFLFNLNKKLSAVAVDILITSSLVGIAENRNRIYFQYIFKENATLKPHFNASFEEIALWWRNVYDLDKANSNYTFVCYFLAK